MDRAVTAFRAASVCAAAGWSIMVVLPTGGIFMQRVPKLVFSLAAATLLAITGTVVATQAVAAEVEADPAFDVPVFNDPAGDPTAQYAIFQQLGRLIDRVPAGETIQMSWFEYKVPDWADTAAKPDITTRLIRAHQRGVNVRIVLDNQTKVWDENLKPEPGWKDKTEANVLMTPYQDLKPELGTNTGASSFIVLCKENTGCIGRRKIGNANAYNHNKFLTASKVVLNNGTVKSGVVFQSSGNLGTWDADTAYNNSITFTEPAAYTNYLNYFADLRAYSTASTGSNNYYRIGNTQDQYKTHFFPRMETNGDLNQASTDTMVSVLDSVKCSYVGETDGLKHQTDIRVLMWSLTRIAVATKLADLVKAGCWVDVVYTNTNASALAALKNVGGKPIGITACAASHGGRTLKVHSKYMLIDGAYDDDQIPRVFMGSHNYSITALRSADETMVRIRSADVHGHYLNENFYKARNFCRDNTTATAATASVLSDAAAATLEATGD
jgi:phosphatidylserine/phosphatidylglycerophosphate/cardiolipin synthase-like enzyme